MSTQIANAMLVMERTTKGAVLYKNPKADGQQAITTLYLRKDGLPATPPATIHVTITTEDQNDA